MNNWVSWVTLKKLAQDTGYTANALRAKIKRGEFEEGVAWCRAPDQRLMINLTFFLEWINSNTNNKDNSEVTDG